VTIVAYFKLIEQSFPDNVMQVNHVGRLLLIMQMKLKDFSKKPLKIGEQKIYLDHFDLFY
jgi:hypothetical protein